MNNDYTHGINKMKKPSTKVMAPPGGKTSINLFGGPAETEQHKINNCQASRNQSNVFGTAPEQKSAPVQSRSSATAAGTAPATIINAAPSNAAPSNAAASASAAPAANAQPKAPEIRPSTKVMAPPGGKSSIFF